VALSKEREPRRRARLSARLVDGTRSTVRGVLVEEFEIFFRRSRQRWPPAPKSTTSPFFARMINAIFIGIDNPRLADWTSASEHRLQSKVEALMVFEDVPPTAICCCKGFAQKSWALLDFVEQPPTFSSADHRPLVGEGLEQLDVMGCDEPAPCA